MRQMQYAIYSAALNLYFQSYEQPNKIRLGTEPRMYGDFGYTKLQLSYIKNTYNMGAIYNETVLNHPEDLAIYEVMQTLCRRRRLE